MNSLKLGSGGGDEADRILVTGGLGFLGSAFVRRFVLRGHDVSIIDVGTYAADPRRLEKADVPILKVDVASAGSIDAIRNLRPDVIVHAAAETHVTRSEGAAESFFKTNVEGTERVLEAAAAIGVRLVIHVSTDEVYGPCPGEPFKEDEKEPGEGLATSPYARSKALADDVAAAYSHRVPIIVVRPTNCFGPWQHPEKAIPRWMVRAISGERLPVWGDGNHIRDWMYSEDLCTAIEMIIQRGEPAHTYNVGPEGESTPNIDIATTIADLAGRNSDSVYLTAYDRPEHDRRYAIDASKVRVLGWRAEGTLTQRLLETFEWYRAHEDWWSALRGDAETIYDDVQEQ